MTSNGIDSEIMTTKRIHERNPAVQWHSKKDFHATLIEYKMHAFHSNSTTA